MNIYKKLCENILVLHNSPDIDYGNYSGLSLVYTFYVVLPVLTLLIFAGSLIMVQIVIKVPREDNTPPEWAMIELQGSLETRHPVALNGRFIGDLHFTKNDVPVLIIGHHILYGKVVSLEKPFAVLVKDSEQWSENEPMETDDENVNKGTSYNVIAIIKKKLLFKTRPKPIIANVPKKL